VIAERPIVSTLLVVACAAGLGMLVARSGPEAQKPKLKTTSVSIVLIDGDCPASTYRAIHFKKTDAVLHCRRDDRGVFVVARYFTTEAWERVAIVDGDGRLIGRMEDRPYRSGDPIRFDYFSE
jgi:hypothetical protein